MRQLAATAVVAAAVLLLGAAGCAQQVPGAAVAAMGADGPPRAGAPTTAGPGTGAPGAPPTSPGAATPLADLDPCAVLSDTARADLGVDGAPQPQRSASGRLCRWLVHDDPAVPDGYALGVSVFPGLGLDQVVASSGKAQLTIGTRRAVRSLRAGGSVCAVSVEITPTSRIDVQATSGSDGAAMCPTAERAARLLEPGFPG
ncbi:DUF3558 family protein [Actinokineospora bangkokensis]|uniref:DUF3558 domain-containing protein n=1 Tax=Actinokineospora bangkokensis TaxID=1193682 RepID=A0A1Q9LJ23_9PSEU|nr:DUF3558 family protein [Actinokineospora bangkokensis]OLR92052.1 hypothetical protein BJP25_22095 [Actinokineospora bangkokensis]